MGEPWLHIIGLGEDGPTSLCPASRAALDAAEIVFGGQRHLDLADAGGRGRAWPVPFSVDPVLAERGRQVAVLASGDPFHFGAGSILARACAPGEWVSWPQPSTFSLAASRLGWALENTLCLGHHAAEVGRLRPALSDGTRAIVLLRDAAAVAEVARWLTDHGGGGSEIVVLERLGGPGERLRAQNADAVLPGDIAAPVALAITARGPVGLPRASGLPDGMFRHDGQITKRPVRALTLSALAPRPGQTLWDIGAGSGSVGVEFLLAAPRSTALAIEPRPNRLAHIRANAAAFGLSHRLTPVEGAAPDALADLPAPDTIFVGGGGSDPVLAAAWDALPHGGRLVANAVTLETEALLTRWHGHHGGSLLRIDLAEAGPLGPRRGWDRARPIVQWSAVK